MADQPINSVSFKFEVIDNASAKIEEIGNSFTKLSKIVNSIKFETGNVEKSFDKMANNTSSENFKKDFETIERTVKDVDKSIKELNSETSKMRGTDIISEDNAKTLEYILSNEGKLEGLENLIEQIEAKLTTLGEKGKGYDNPTVNRLVKQLMSAHKEFDKIEEEMERINEVSPKPISADYITSNEGKLEGLSTRINNIKQQIAELGEQGQGYDNPTVARLVKQLETAQRDFEKIESQMKQVETEKPKPLTSEFVISDEGKLQGTEKRIISLKQQLDDLTAQGQGFENPVIRKIVNDLEKANKEVENFKAQIQGVGTGLEKVTVSDDIKAQANELQTLNGQIEHYKARIESLQQQLETLLANGEPMGSPAITRIITQIGTAQNKIETLSAAMSRVNMPTEPVIVTEEISQRIERLMSDEGKLETVNARIADIKTQLAELFSQGYGNENPAVSKLIKQLENAQKEADKLKQKIAETNNQNASSQSASFSQKFISSFNKIKSGASKLKAVGSIIKKSLEIPLKAASKAAQKAVSPFKKFGKSISKIFSSFKRILFYRAIRGVIKAITEAVKTGVNNLYQYSKALNGMFADSLDRISTSMLYFKNSIGAAVAPLINVLAPAIERIIDLAANVGNSIAETIARLTGAETYVKAIKYSKEYAEATNQITKANKHAIASFDELNNITSSTDEKSKNEQDYSKMFEEVKVDKSKFNIFDEIKTKIVDKDWEGLGTSLANKLNRIVDKVAKTDVGGKIASKINSSLDFLYSFLNTFNFSNFASALVTNINNFFQKTSWRKVGRTIAAGFNSAIDFIGTAIKEFNFIVFIRSLTTALSEMLDNVKWEKLGELVSNAFKGLFDIIWGISDWLWNKGGMTSIFNALARLIDGVDWVGLTEKLVSHAIQMVVDVIAWLLNPMNWDNLIYQIVKAAGEILWGAIKGLFLFDGKKQYPARDTLNDIKKMGYRPKGVRAFANGGYPATGQMFIARESGAELVGTIGNRTAVANNDQIVQAVSAGVYSAVVDAMSKTSGSDSGETVINIDGREVFRAVRNQNNSFRRRTGQSAF